MGGKIKAGEGPGDRSRMGFLMLILRPGLLSRNNMMQGQVLIGSLNRYFTYNQYYKRVLMETVLIQINNQKAYKLLKNLEQQKLIRILKKNTPPQGKLSEKYAGKLSSDTADRLQEHVTQSRKEWQNRTI